MSVVRYPLVATPATSGRVRDASGGQQVPRQNGVRSTGANQVTINGFTAGTTTVRLHVVNVSGYEFNHLNATLVGVY